MRESEFESVLRELRVCLELECGSWNAGALREDIFFGQEEPSHIQNKERKPGYGS